MRSRVETLFLSFIFGLCVSHAEPVSFITKCKPGDGKCAKESSQAALPIFVDGIPDLGLGSLDPLVIPKVDASASGLKLIVTDLSVKGLKGCRIKKMSHDPATNKIAAKALCDVILDGQYEMSGQLLVLPMEGKGPVHAKLRKIQISADIDLEDIEEGGKKYWNVKNWKHTYELKDKADVVFENLFPNNELLGRTARDLIKNNGNDIILEVGPPVVKKVLAHLVSNVNKFFHKVPTEDLIDYS